MSETARVALAVVCFSVALLAQLTGIALLVGEGRRTGDALRRWRDARSGVGGRDTPAGAPVRAEELDGLVDHLLGNRFDRATAAVLLLVGVVAGALGSLLSL
ncbi:hypothetical protein DQ238_04220 [Geodermatophilus sp. TF02-6]|uniref:hypothetical protein n=1 Tax=Geodermatophilus sp. TF02-6 TaxID=2250575 RepID=UPI000DE88EFD|nr:hypothetical protein [Geodermatophilus sp. TF02-6]RBY82499.1 hypothetical protein DQ238_04220 [Geodermatophilus sp. TF02-6]